MLEHLKKTLLSTRSAPVAIFVLCALAFGPLLGQLGFYWDDWPVILTAHLKGSFWEYYAYNRPGSAWTHAFTAPWLGTSPLRWHLFGEISWALIAVSFWWMLEQLWPARKRTNLWMALLFAVHPIYLIHPITVTFIQHNLTYIAFFLSFGAMLAAMRQPRRFWLWTGVGVGMNLIHAFSMEYFWGLELVRPVLIFLVLGETVTHWRQQIGPGLRIWLPYLVATGAAVIWRMFFVQLARHDPNELVLVGKLVESPVAGLLELAQMVLKDSAYIVIIRWFETFQVAWLEFSDRFGWIAWGVGIVSAGVFWFYFRREEPEGDGENTRPVFQTVSVGLWALMMGGLSAWLAGRQLTVGLYADRFALPMLVGVALMTVGLVEGVVRPRGKPLAFAILLGLAVAMQLRTQNNYRWDWVNQQRAFWQLYWRAPALADHTVIFSDGSLFRYTGEYPTAMAVNVLYPQYRESNEMSYWFLELDRGYSPLLPEMVAGDFPILADFRQYTFSSTSRQSLVVYYEPDQGNCLWVMRSSDRYNPDIPELTRRAVPLSNLNQIIVDTPGTPPDAQAFGAEPARTWCYFYQKAELARQQEDWGTIVGLAEASAAQGFSPNNRLEWLPFVEAYAHTGGWARAIELSVDALNYSRSTRNLFCPIWRGFEREGLNAPARTFGEMYERLGCETGVDE